MAIGMALQGHHVATPLEPIEQVVGYAAGQRPVVRPHEARAGDLLGAADEAQDGDAVRLYAPATCRSAR